MSIHCKMRRFFNQMNFLVLLVFKKINCQAFPRKIQVDPFTHHMDNLNILRSWLRWSHVYLLSYRILKFAKLLAQIIWARTQFPEHDIGSICLDNVWEFISPHFNEYCLSTGINVRTSCRSCSYYKIHWITSIDCQTIDYEVVSSPILIWGHVILHAAVLVRIRPKSSHKFSSCNWSLKESLIFSIL